MNTYTVLSVGGRLLAQSPDRAAARRAAQDLANQCGYWVELHGGPVVEFIHPARVSA
jgi:hypothetical protein